MRIRIHFARIQGFFGTRLHLRGEIAGNNCFFLRRPRCFLFFEKNRLLVKPCHLFERMYWQLSFTKQSCSLEDWTCLKTASNC